MVACHTPSSKGTAEQSSAIARRIESKLEGLVDSGPNATHGVHTNCESGFRSMSVCCPAYCSPRSVLCPQSIKGGRSQMHSAEFSPSALQPADGAMDPRTQQCLRKRRNRDTVAHHPEVPQPPPGSERFASGAHSGSRKATPSLAMPQRIGMHTALITLSTCPHCTS